MAQPQAYNRTVDFTQRDGDDTDHAGINAEFDATALSVNEIRDNLALIQKDDGGLANGIVTPDSLTPEVFEALTQDIGDQVTDAQAAAQSALTSATTANNAATAAANSAAAAATSQTAAALNASSASTSASNASTSETNAANSAASALSSKNAAATSEANADADATTAITKAGEAAASATAASGSATTATTQAGIATTKAGEASTSAGTATTQAGIATTKAAQAAASALAAALDAALLLTSVAGTNTVTASTTPATTGYQTGQLFKFIPVNNNTGAMTINVDGQGAAPITKNGTDALVVGDVKAGQAYLLMRDAVGNFQLSGGAGGGITSATGANGDKIFHLNKRVMTGSFTIPAGYSGLMTGPLETPPGMYLEVLPGDSVVVL